MKATLATLACLLTVGFLSAAEVAGNNTAVVIRKNVVASDNGYQFLCVPVNGLDITGNKTGTVKLSTLLPAATLEAGTTVTVDSTTYTVTDGAWSADPDLAGGTIFWVKAPTAASSQSGAQSLAAMLSGAVTTYDTPVAQSEPKTVIFCGQDRGERTKDAATAGIATAMKNDSSVAVTLATIGTDVSAKNGDQILTIQAGSSEYNIYRYLGSVWYGPGFNNNCNTVEIAPGEAFYYYTK